MTYAIALLAVALVALVGLLAVRSRVAAPPPVAAHSPPPDRSALAGRVSELEAQLPAVVRRVQELDDSTQAQFRRIWGAVSVDRRADRQPRQEPATDPLTPDGEGFPAVLTPELAKSLGITLPTAHPDGNIGSHEISATPLAPLPARPRMRDLRRMRG